MSAPFLQGGIGTLGELALIATPSPEKASLPLTERTISKSTRGQTNLLTAVWSPGQTQLNADAPRSSGIRGQNPPPQVARRGRARRDHHHHPAWPRDRSNCPGGTSSATGNRRGDRRHQGPR